MAYSTRLLRRQDGSGDFDAGKLLLELLQEPFVGQFQQTSVWTALGTSLGFTAFIALCFSFLRPYHQAVYAPRLKHADERHAPPIIGKKAWSWFTPLWRTSEADLISHIGMDGTIFLRFTRMCRNIFLAMSLVGICILVPVHLTRSANIQGDITWLQRITPSNLFSTGQWAQVVAAWLMNIVVCFFLWWNYRKVLQLRRDYLNSEDYQNSLHARTLMLHDIPRDRCSDEGMARIIDEVVPNSSFARTAIARNVKDLPDLISQHDRTVRKLEKVLAVYLRNPQQLPNARPTCTPSKKDPAFSTYPKGQKLDAIEYLTQRIKDLEIQIREVRQSVDRRSTMPYGFASYAEIAEAHSIAHACRKKKPHGARITLAPRPNDIIWDNMPLSPSVRSWKRIMNNIWVTVLTILWIAPNAMIAIFLVNLNNRGKVWPAFRTSLIQNPTVWGMVQGVASPAITSLVYLILPIIFRRLLMLAGDRTKTGRERHVLAKLYGFFVFNNLVVFTFFSAIWSLVAGVIQETNKGTDAWHALIQEKPATGLFLSLCQVSPFWVTWLLQRQLGAAIDLSQLWPLMYGFFVKKFSSPTPRELIELTAPPPFDYASYYNYFLFYTTVALCYSGIQPLVLPAAALYFVIDVFLKKYLLLYVFITKTESGGMFWRTLFNRFVFGTILADLVYFLTTFVRGDDPPIQGYAVVPLPFLMIAFKIYCARVFDGKIHYYSTRHFSKHPESGVPKGDRLRSERLASRFGHPALYKPLITPMVYQKAQNLLHVVYKGRLSDGREAGSGDMMSVSGYSDTYALDSMKAGKPGKPAQVPGFEFVSESHLDFEYYKDRPEFAAEHGAGELFGNPSDIIRPGTPGSMFGDSDHNGSRPGTSSTGKVAGGMTGRRVAPDNPSTPAYAPHPVHMSPPHWSPTPQSGFLQQPATGDPTGRPRSPLYQQPNDSSSSLVGRAAAMPAAAAGRAHSREASLDHTRMRGHIPGPSLGALGGGPRGYSGLAQSDEADQTMADPTQYDYFRGVRPRRSGAGW